MNKSYKRDRLQKELQKIINAAFNGQIDDERLSGIEVTYVKISPDLSFLKVYFTDYIKELPPEKLIPLLIKSSGFIKKQIAGVGIMRTIPQITFEHDNSTQRAEHIENIFKRIAEEKRNNDYYDDDSDNEYYQDDELEDEDLEDNDEDIDEEIDIDYDDLDDPRDIDDDDDEDEEDL